MIGSHHAGRRNPRRRR